MTTTREAAYWPVVELAAFVVLVAVDLWLAWDRPWLQILCRSLAAGILLPSFIRRHGLQPPPTTTGRALSEAAAVTLAMGIAVLAWAVAASGPLDEWDSRLLAGPASATGLWLSRHLALAFLQQLALHLFLWPVAREVLRRDVLTTSAIALLFGLFHLPSLALALATAIAGGLWIILYRRSRRLAPLIASHVLLAAVASTVPERLFLDMEVGTPALRTAADQRYLARQEVQTLLRTISSPRYTAFQGGTDSGYVSGLYRDILGRVATADEVRRGVEQLTGRHSAGKPALISPLGLAKRMLLAEEFDDATLWRRRIDDRPLAPSIDVSPSSDDVEFVGWYEADDAWRWAREPEPTIGFQLARESDRAYVLALSGGAATGLTVELELNGHLVGSRGFTDITPRDHRFLIDAAQLVDGDNTLRFLIAGAPMAVQGDPRALGFGLRQLRIAPLRFPTTAVFFTDDDYFLEGFSVAEAQLRWTLEPTARLAYPLPEIEAEGCYTLQLRAGAFERQDVGASIGGLKLADWSFDGLEPQIRSVRLDAASLQTGPNLVDFSLPGARSPEGDPRQLGLAFISLRIYPLKDCS